MIIKILILVSGFICAFAVGLLLARIMRLRAEKILASAEEELDQLYSEMQAQQILNLTIISILVMAVVGFILTRSVIMAIIFAVVGYFIPKFYLKRQQKKRLDSFKQQIVPAIDLIANSLKPCFSLPQGFEMISKEMKPPISQEFEMVMKENRMGVSLEEALNNLAGRIPSGELELVITATNIARKTGGNLAEVYDRIAKTIRDRDQMLGKIKALTAEGRMQGIFVGAMPILLGLGITLIDPELMRPMFTTTLGYILIGFIILLEVMGYIFIKKITTVDV